MPRIWVGSLSWSALESLMGEVSQRRTDRLTLDLDLAELGTRLPIHVLQRLPVADIGVAGAPIDQKPCPRRLHPGPCGQDQVIDPHHDTHPGRRQ